MSKRSHRHSFASRAGDADSLIKTAESRVQRADNAAAFTTRLTIEVMPVLRGCATVAAFRHGITVADMRPAHPGRAFPNAIGESSWTTISRRRHAPFRRHTGACGRSPRFS